MTIKQKAKQLALTLIGEDQNPQPLIDTLVEMALWQNHQIMKTMEYVYAIKTRGGDYLFAICKTYADAKRYMQDFQLTAGKYYIKEYRVYHFND